MRSEDTYGLNRYEHSMRVEWHDCTWQPSIVLRQAVSLPLAAITKPLPMPAFLPHPARRKNLFKLMKNKSAGPRRYEDAGFTLVELLTVIAIIAILASMLLVVVSKTKVAALKAKARIEISDIVNAIQSYDSAYGRFPVSANAQTAAGNASNPGGDFTYGGTFQNGAGSATLGTPTSGSVLTNDEVMAVLMDYTNYPNSSLPTINVNYQKNPQKTTFLNAKLSGWNPSTMTGTPWAGVDNNLVYRDPWGNPYLITMDLNYDEQCNDFYYSKQSVSQSSGQQGYNGLSNPDSGGTSDNFKFHGKVMVWSMGPDGKYDASTGSPTPANAGFNKDNILSWQ